ncbi:VirB8 protein [Pseudovibrio axinellae]|uniref:VirB8 protein n=1 Tax=Pseudovibrio axinellae TaxID=989403 RepID=A0A165ZZ88_9HYPH|nr:VirB8/TrbF family protein [Pseudovibrio axinellae]KZL20426.1 VirB8 protein [Pseudovibrio axinellae]SER77457.1 type IV secretion system protein VirB8 [Pseudovibrio axinellae]
MFKWKRKDKGKSEPEGGTRTGFAVPVQDNAPEVSLDDPPQEAPPAQRKAVLDADPFAYKAAHRRMVTLFRISAGLNVVLGVCLALSLQAIAVVLPLKTTEIALLRVDPADERIYRVEPISVEVDGFELMLEKMARRYVAQILAVDQISQSSRFREVATYSDQDFYRQFLKENEGRIDEAIEDGLNRSITVESANQVDAYDGVYQYAVDFIQTDRIGRTKPEQSRLRAYVEMTTRPQEVTSVERFENPLGIRILKLAVQERPTT